MTKLHLHFFTLKISINLMVVKDAISVLTWIPLVMCKVERTFNCSLAIRVSCFMNDLCISLFFFTEVLPFLIDMI